MLKLKKVQILGFKSFCDRTEVQLSGSGMAAVVGPNGCGKSNISDAITWVLGEQSAKSLRGTHMQDVIFAGTRDRKPTGMAEVSLTLVDPEVYDGNVPEDEQGEADWSSAPAAEIELAGDWDEVELRRRRAEETEEAVLEAQPGVVIEGEGAPIPSAEIAANGVSESAENLASDMKSATAEPAVVLKVRRRKFGRAPVRAGEVTITR
ncbi:MAG TPA: AAA family ATPase, partial [Acidobacteriaceae bacterium]|nr:AAA family ATPase [Acidobacteriaceae bacterium]